MGVHLPDVSVSLTLVLCSCAFFFGRFTLFVSQVPESRAPEIIPSESLETNSGRRNIKEVADKATDVAQPSSALVDPLHPDSEQNIIKASGLLNVRPLLPVAASGNNFYHAIPFQILSWYPRVVVYPGFIDKHRCEQIIKAANDTMYPSAVAFRPGEAFDRNQQTRTSKGAFMMSRSDPSGSLEWLEQRIAQVTMIRSDYGEPFNVLHYQHMQHYDSHYDTFDPKEYGPQNSQRIATVLTVLQAPEEGGETVFKHEGEDGEERPVMDWRNCDDGSYKYIPRQGDAVLFWTVKTNGDIDHHALHGGCPVKKGEKWVATKWIRSKPIFGSKED